MVSPVCGVCKVPVQGAARQLAFFPSWSESGERSLWSLELLELEKCLKVTGDVAPCHAFWTRANVCIELL